MPVFKRVHKLQTFNLEAFSGFYSIVGSESFSALAPPNTNIHVWCENSRQQSVTAQDLIHSSQNFLRRLLCCYLVLIISFEHLKVIYLQSPKAQQNHYVCSILSAFHSLMAPKNQRKQNPDQNFLPIPGLFDISLEKCWRDSRSNCTFIWCSLDAVASCASSLSSGIRPGATRCNVSTVLTCQGEVTADPPHWHSRCFPANVY